MEGPAHDSRRRFAAAFWIAALMLAAAGLAAAADERDGSCRIETRERIVAVGDVHGAYERFVAILRQARVIDARDRWTGGRTVLVQTGDVVDRGPDSRRALDLLRRLEREAARAGGRVVPLLGNHEVMWMLGDLRYVSAGEYASFRSSGSEDLRERYYRVLLEQETKRQGGADRDVDAFRKRFLDSTPLGSIELQMAVGPKGEYGTWLRARDAVAIVNGIAFVHGGFSPSVAPLGCEGVNQQVRKDLADAFTAPPSSASDLLMTREDGPLWYRGLATEPESAFSEPVDGILRALGARAIVVGHTVTATGRIAPRFGGRVVQIDTGMLDGDFFPGGRASALEILNGKLTAIYEDGRVELIDVPAAPAATAR
jgi:hypothetical protein